LYIIWLLSGCSRVYHYRFFGFRGSSSRHARCLCVLCACAALRMSLCCFADGASCRTLPHSARSAVYLLLSVIFCCCAYYAAFCRTMRAQLCIAVLGLGVPLCRFNFCLHASFSAAFLCVPSCSLPLPAAVTQLCRVLPHFAVLCALCCVSAAPCLLLLLCRILPHLAALCAFAVHLPLSVALPYPAELCRIVRIRCVVSFHAALCRFAVRAACWRSGRSLRCIVSVQLHCCVLSLSAMQRSVNSAQLAAFLL
jgi:hypothetical protein